MAKSAPDCYTGSVERVKKVAKVIPAGHWPDSAVEGVLYWVTRPAEERIEAGRELVRSTYQRLHGRPLPRMAKVARIFKPEP